MYAFYKEKKYWITSLIILILEGILSFYLSSFFNKINCFFPMLTISLIPFLYTNNIQDYNKKLFILGIIYDLLYSNLFLFHPFVFLLLGKIDINILKYFKKNIVIYFLIIFINLLIYDGIFFVLVFLTNYEIVTLNDYFYKIRYSLINIPFGSFYYLIFKHKNI